MIRIVLAGAPKGKGRPRFIKSTGRAITPQATRSYEAVLRLAAQEIMGDRPLLEGPLKMLVVASMPIAPSWPKKKQALARENKIRPTSSPDWDNIAKTSDALNKVVWNDDGQLVDVRVLKFYSDKPELVVEISPITDFMEL